MRHYVVILILWLMILFPVGATSVKAQTSTCPSSNVIRLIQQPIPSAFNLLTGSGESVYTVTSIEKMGVYPFNLILKNGSLWWADVVTDWATANSNYTEWTFNVRPGLKWSDGTDVTSQDIINNFGTPGKMFADPNVDIVGLSSELVRSFALNSSAMTFVLNQTDAHFGERISSYYDTPLEPPKDVAEGANGNHFGTDVGTGPFYVSNYTSGSTTLVMPRNPYYHYPTPAACAVDVSFVENEGAYSTFLISGQADIAGLIPFGSMAALVKVPFLGFNINKAIASSVLEYNVYHYPYNQNAFRQALAFGINDSAAVQRGLAGYGVPASDAQGEIADTYASYNPNQMKYAYNPTKALSLLESIGMTKAADGTLQYRNGTAVSLTLWVDTNKVYDIDVAKSVIDDLTSLGFKMTLHTVSVHNMVGDFAANALGIRNDMVLYSSGGPSFPDIWSDAQPPCGTIARPGCNPDNPSDYPAEAVAAYNSNLTAIDRTNDPTQLQKYWDNIQAINAQYLPMVQIAFPDLIWAYNTQRWTNWPQYPSIFGTNTFNGTALAALVPAGLSSTTTSSVSPSPDYTSMIAGVIAIIAIGGLVVFALKRRKRQ